MLLFFYRAVTDIELTEVVIHNFYPRVRGAII